MFVEPPPVAERPRRASIDHDDVDDESEAGELDDDGGAGDDDDGSGRDDDGDGDAGGDGREWVTAGVFWTATEAQLARLRLESRGIPVLVLDENIVATDWLVANAVGGIKVQVPAPALLVARSLLVRPARDAVERGDGQPVSDGQVLCPRCGSADIYQTLLSRRLSFIAVFVCALLLPFAFGRRSRCAACGYEWR